MHTKRTVLILILSLISMVLFGQYQYSIDREKLKQSRRLTVKEFFENQRQKRNEKRVASEMAKIDKKTDAIARKYEKKKQTEIVRKRMKESRKMAQKFNKGKPPVDFITYIEYKTKKYYGQFF